MKLKILFLMCSLSVAFFASGKSFETDKFITKDGGELVITFIKHGSLELTFNGHHIQVDPVSEYADYSVFPKADIILITHEHGNHLDPKAISALEKNGTLLITNEASSRILGKGTVMKNGDKLTPVDYMDIEAVPAYNTTPGHEKFHPRHRDNGYILTLGGTRVYIAGDTEDIPELKELKDIDIAFLPVNQPYTMTVPQAIHAAKMFSPKVLYPYHYGDTKIEELKEGLKSSTIDIRIRQMQ
ncbi:MBL fold metallo-hydrolase [uncultured Parabacteroides sp.]|jgi:L-ascorbate metabolism protein UlaG (beta-lactamase superfamily)|uniref:MBL fold metallo-hydrolase n=1 Tax=uncultured Parabacteroides sp. TaxID=512312 RepID=UPI0025F48176|nr:MBL fold metallo-hydrolase [uncultured Parabacteroides sp.]